MARSRSKKPVWLDRDALPPLPYSTLCLTPEAFATACAHLKVTDGLPSWITPGAGATTHFFEHPDKDSVVAVVCIAVDAKKYSYEQHAAMLVHEGVHVWQEYRDNTLRESKPCSELEAYCIQRIAQNLLVSLTEQTKKRKRHV